MDENLSTKIQFFVSCTGLKSRDLLSKSDPFAEVKITNRGSLYDLGQTEYIKNDNDPQFTKQFVVDYFFEEVQQLNIKLWDYDGSGNKHDFLGEASFTLGDVMGSRGQIFKTPVVYKGRHEGIIIIRAEPVNAGGDKEFLFAFQCKKLDAKDFNFGFGKSDPFYAISRCNEDGSFMEVFRSEKYKKDLNPRFKQQKLSLSRLCNNDVARPVLIRVYDYDGDGSHDLIGEFQTSIEGLLRGSNDAQWFPLVHPPTKKKYKKKSYKDSGKLLCTMAALHDKPSFVNYLQGGLQISLAVAIDFTGSNGNPASPSSLHFRNANGYNQYQTAILNIGNILQSYDWDKSFPVLGFGGRIGGGTSHCFMLQPDEVYGVGGILQAYNNSFANVKLSGPTIFNQIIRHVANSARQPPATQYNQVFQILLILTDGVINDMAETIDALVEASELPMSVVIVGVGNADFRAMEALDGDDGLLRNSRGKSAARDIVQFVPFTKYANSVGALTRETLAEIPQQVCEYFTKKGIMPNPPLQATMATASVVNPPAQAVAPPPMAPSIPDVGRQIFKQAHAL